MNQELIKELIQYDCSEKNIIRELKKVLDLNNRNRLLDKYDSLISLLGEPGSSKRIAEDIVLKI